MNCSCRCPIEFHGTHGCYTVGCGCTRRPDTNHICECKHPHAVHFTNGKCDADHCHCTSFRLIRPDSSRPEPITCDKCPHPVSSHGPFGCHLCSCLADHYNTRQANKCCEHSLLEHDTNGCNECTCNLRAVHSKDDIVRAVLDKGEAMAMHAPEPKFSIEKLIERTKTLIAETEQELQNYRTKLKDIHANILEDFENLEDPEEKFTRERNELTREIGIHGHKERLNSLKSLLETLQLLSDEDISLSAETKQLLNLSMRIL